MCQSGGRARERGLSGRVPCVLVSLVRAFHLTAKGAYSTVNTTEHRKWLPIRSLSRAVLCTSTFASHTLPKMV